MPVNKNLILILFLLLPFTARSQSGKTVFDSNYVEPHPELVNLRLYLSNKFTNFNINIADQDRKYVYRPNSGLNLGLGFTYQNVSLNLAFPVEFLNPGRRKDWPAYLDLQSHIYLPRMIIDLFGQFYRGYSVSDQFLINQRTDYLREDMKLNSLGFNFNYLFNGEQISLAASMNQAAIQKKSAYSPFLGFELYGGSVKGDSLLLPTVENLDLLNFAQSRYFQFGPNAGAAATLVFGKGFFVTVVGSLNLSVGYNEWENSTVSRKWGLVPTYFARTFFGYNDRRFSINANAVYKNLNLIESGLYDQAVNTGNIRFNIIYKLAAGPKLERGFNKVNPLRLSKKN